MYFNKKINYFRLIIFVIKKINISNQIFTEKNYSKYTYIQLYLKNLK